jgi:hypothetical protein
MAFKDSGKIIQMVGEMYDICLNAIVKIEIKRRDKKN